MSDLMFSEELSGRLNLFDPNSISVEFGQLRGRFVCIKKEASNLKLDFEILDVTTALSMIHRSNVSNVIINFSGKCIDRFSFSLIDNYQVKIVDEKVIVTVEGIYEKIWE